LNELPTLDCEDDDLLDYMNCLPTAPTFDGNEVSNIYPYGVMRKFVFQTLNPAVKQSTWKNLI
jgi:hypothetical protein